MFLFIFNVNVTSKKVYKWVNLILLADSFNNKQNHYVTKYLLLYTQHVAKWKFKYLTNSVPILFGFLFKILKTYYLVG